MEAPADWHEGAGFSSLAWRSGRKPGRGAAFQLGANPATGMVHHTCSRSLGSAPQAPCCWKPAPGRVCRANGASARRGGALLALCAGRARAVPMGSSGPGFRAGKAAWGSLLATGPCPACQPCPAEGGLPLQTGQSLFSSSSHRLQGPTGVPKGCLAGGRSRCTLGWGQRAGAAGGDDTVSMHSKGGEPFWPYRSEQPSTETVPAWEGPS